MTPDDKWKVAAARAPKIPRRSPETGAVPSPGEAIEPGGAQETAWQPLRANRLRHGRRPPHARQTGSRIYGSRGMLFGGLRPVPRDQLDPLLGACFNCRQRGDSKGACHEPRTIFCYNCGRQETTLRDCPRCGEVHKEYVREQGSLRRVETPSRESPRPPRRRDASLPSASQHRTSRGDQPSISGPETSTSSRTGATAIPAPPSSRPDNTGHIELPGSIPTTRATPTTPSLTLVVYFSTISHLPGDLQEALLRAFLAQKK